MKLRIGIVLSVLRQGYELDGPGFEFRQGVISLLSVQSRQTPALTQPRIQSVLR